MWPLFCMLVAACVRTAAPQAVLADFPAAEPPTHNGLASASAITLVGCVDGSVRALDAWTGALLWSFSTGPAVVASDAPLPHEPEGAVMELGGWAAASGPAVVPAVDGTLYEVAEDGVLAPLAMTVADVVDASVTLLPSTAVLVGKKSTAVFSLDAATGSLGGALVLARHDYTATAYHSSGEVHWNVTVGTYSLKQAGNVSSSFTVLTAPEFPRIALDEHSGMLSGADPLTGEALWTRSVPSAPVSVFGVARDRGIVYERSLFAGPSRGPASLPGASLSLVEDSLVASAAAAAAPGPAAPVVATKHSQITDGGLFVSWRLALGLALLVGVIAAVAFQWGRKRQQAPPPPPQSQSPRLSPSARTPVVNPAPSNPVEALEKLPPLIALELPPPASPQASQAGTPSRSMRPLRGDESADWSDSDELDSPPRDPPDEGGAGNGMSPPGLTAEFPAYSPRSMALSASQTSPAMHPHSIVSHVSASADDLEARLQELDEPLHVCSDRYRSEFYELEEIGHGGFGRVFRCENKLDRRACAIKKVRARSVQELRLVLREVQSLALLDHANIVRYYQAWLEEDSPADRDSSPSAGDSASSSSSLSSQSRSAAEAEVSICSSVDSTWGRRAAAAVPPVAHSAALNNLSNGGFEWEQPEPDVADFDYEVSSSDRARQEAETRPLRHLALYIQMQYCSARTLRDFLDKSQRVAAVIDLGHVLRIFAQLCTGLHHVHSQGLIHRDLKPENIFFMPSGILKIGDFGLSRQVISADPPPSRPRLRSGDSSDERHTGGVGTSMYASPEQLKGDNYSSKSDLYSLGLILFEMTYPAFATSMERARVMTAARERRFPDEWPLRESHPELIGLLGELLAPDPADRPTADAVVGVCDLFQGSTTFRGGARGGLLLRVLTSVAPAPKKDALLILVAAVVRENCPAAQIAQLSARNLAGREVLELTLDPPLVDAEIRSAMQSLKGMEGVGDVRVITL